MGKILLATRRQEQENFSRIQDAIRSLLQSILDSYHRLGIGRLQPGELQRMISNPEIYVKQRIQPTAIAGQNLPDEKIELPDGFPELEKLCLNFEDRLGHYRSHLNWSFFGTAEGKIKFTSAYEQALNSFNTYIETDQDQQKYDAMCAHIDDLNTKYSIGVPIPVESLPAWARFDRQENQFVLLCEKIKF